jgi:DNA mismatch repair protein MSH3
MDLPDLAVEALALTICHLKGFDFERILCLGALRPFVSNTEMTLSAIMLMVSDSFVQMMLNYN